MSRTANPSTTSLEVLYIQPTTPHFVKFGGPQKIIIKMDTQDPINQGSIEESARQMSNEASDMLPSQEQYSVCLPSIDN
jgi:hypothetical protein